MIATAPTLRARLPPPGSTRRRTPSADHRTRRHDWSKQASPGTGQSVDGLAAGLVVALLATPRLLPLVSWTVTVLVVLTWVWWISWPQDPEGTKRLAEQESTNKSTDVWLIAAAVRASPWWLRHSFSPAANEGLPP